MLSGDFLLSRATVLLSELGEPEVVRLMADVIDEMVAGELMQVYLLNGGVHHSHAGPGTLQNTTAWHDQQLRTQSHAHACVRQALPYTRTFLCACTSRARKQQRRNHNRNSLSHASSSCTRVQAKATPKDLLSFDHYLLKTCARTPTQTILMKRMLITICKPGVLQSCPPVAPGIERRRR